MKIKLFFFSCFAILFSLILSCTKYEKMLDIDWDNMDINGTMNFGVPLIDAKYSAERLLNDLGNLENITFKPDGIYKLEYSAPQKAYLNVEKYTKFSNSVINSFLDLSQQDTLHLFINAYTDDVELRKATLKTGYIRFDFSQLKGNPSDDYEILITSTTLFNENNTPFATKLTKNHLIENAPCANLKVITSDNKIDFLVKFIPISGNSTLFYPKIESHDITVKNAEIKLLKEQRESFSSSTEFHIFPRINTLEATVYYPKLSLDITNTFGMYSELLFTAINLTGKHGIDPILRQDHKPIKLEAFFTGSLDISDQILAELPLNVRYDSLHFEYVSIVPAGTYNVTDNSVVMLGMTAVVPFDIKIEKSVYYDTLNFNIPKLSDLTFFDTISLRTAFSNSLPLEVDAQFWFYNSKTQKVIDSLFSKAVKIKGSYNNIMVSSEPQYLHITNDKLKALQQIDKIIFKVQFNTNGQHIPIRESNMLHAKMGARIKSTIN